jgi:hypothetical protein
LKGLQLLDRAVEELDRDGEDPQPAEHDLHW